MALWCEAFHDGVVGYDVMGVTTHFQCGVQDGIGVTVVGNHYLLVATVRANGEASSVFCVKLADWLFLNINFISS